MCEGFFKFLNRLKRFLGFGKDSKPKVAETPEKKANK